MQRREYLIKTLSENSECNICNDSYIVNDIYNNAYCKCKINICKNCIKKIEKCPTCPINYKGINNNEHIELYFELINKPNYNINYINLQVKFFDYIKKDDFDSVKKYLPNCVNLIKFNNNYLIKIINLCMTTQKIDYLKFILLESKINLNIIIHKTLPLLFFLSVFENFEVMNWLIEQGVKIDTRAPNGNTLLHHAVLIDSTKIIDYYKKDLLYLKNNYGHTPLMISILQNKVNIFNFLCQIINSESSKHFSFRLAMKEDKLEIVKTLLESKIDINIQHKKRGSTHLMSAVKMNKINSVKLLLQENANVNLQDKNGNTALHFSKDIETTNLLLRGGADTTIQNNKGEPALYEPNLLDRFENMLKEIFTLNLN